MHVDTDLFTLTIKGKPIHPDIKQLYPERDKDLKAKLELNLIGCKLQSLSYFNPSKGLVKSEEISKQVYPFFYEQQNYLIFIEGKSDELSLDFYHENKSIREAVTPYPEKKNQLMGIINFRNDVGYSELEVRGNGQTLLIMTIEVFPSKIDYRYDYQKLLREVNQDIYNLAYEFCAVPSRGQN